MKSLYPISILLFLSQLVQAQPCNLPKPTNLFITHEDGCRTVFHWDPVANASGYAVKYALLEDTQYTQYPPTGETSFTFQPGTILPNTEYIFAVACVCSNNELGGYEKLIAVDTACEPPTDVQATTTNNFNVKFMWSNCWESQTNQMRYRYTNQTSWTYVPTGSLTATVFPIPRSGTLLYQASALSDTTPGCWSAIQSIDLSLPPNVVVILLDDIRYDTYSCNGAPSFYQSPNIDRIANEGVNFKNSFVVFSLCNPSRATILTGLYPNHNGAVNNKSLFYDYLPTIGTALDSMGYYTVFLGKYLNAIEEDPQPQPGWDYWMARIGSGHIDATFNWNGHVDSNAKGHVTDVLTDTAVALINRAHQPFLIYICYTTHPPWVPRKQDARQYSNVEMEVPENYYKYQENYPNFIYNTIFTATDSATIKEDTRHYYQVLYGVDKEVEKIINALDAQNILDSTLLLFTSDNGYLFGEHKLEGKRLPYEESARVPMFIRYPRWFPPHSIDTTHMVLNVDIAPTLFELANIPDIPSDGLSMHKLFDNDIQRKAFYYQGTHLNDSSVNVRSVRDFSYKYNYYYCDNLTEEFFDLVHDPYENTNLINNKSYQDLIQQYRLKKDSFKNALGDNIVEEMRPCYLAYPVIIDTPIIADVFFPNPAYDIVNIEFEDVVDDEVADIVIYNMNGIRVYELDNIYFLPGRLVRLNIASLENGLYDVQVRFSNRTRDSKLIIMK